MNFLTCIFISIAIPLWCPSEMPRQEYIGEFTLSRYYTVVPEQKRYYLNKTFQEDFAMNCSGDCFITANGHRLTDKEWGKVAACPPDIKLGTKLHVDGLGEIVCHDRGGSIKNKRLDIWMGSGDEGLDRIYSRETSYPGKRKTFIINY